MKLLLIIAAIALSPITLFILAWYALTPEEKDIQRLLDHRA